MFHIKTVMIVLGLVIVYMWFRRRYQGQRGTWDSKQDIQEYAILNSFDKPAPKPRTAMRSQLAAAVNGAECNDSIGERLCRRHLEKRLGVPFRKERPAFLKNPVTDNNLELDCFNSGMRLALEYNGKQHYEWVPKFHKTKTEFHAQKYRDEIKRRLCYENGVDLIEVPYTVSHKDIDVPAGVSRDTVMKILKDALLSWSTFINLTFVYSDFETSDVIIAFRVGKHKEDSSKFDGPRGVLAHATVGSNPGFIHFDMDENWIWDEHPSFFTRVLSFRPIFRNVAVHEIGHLLGLDHRNVYDSIMNTYYVGAISEPSASDIAEARKIYGRNPNGKDPAELSVVYYFLLDHFITVVVVVVMIIVLNAGSWTIYNKWGKRGKYTGVTATEV